VGVNAETYVLPLDAVVECLELPRDEARHNNDLCGVIDLRGDPLPYVRLRSLFQLDGTAPNRESVVVVQSGESRTGVVVDRLFGEAQQVIKPLGKMFKDLSSVSGSTVLGSGKVALILDVSGLLAAGNGSKSMGAARGGAGL
jgi:two-component system chemotaxis sensor kinase CheA